MSITLTATTTIYTLSYTTLFRSLTVLEDGSHTFAAADFGFTDPVDAANGAHGADARPEEHTSELQARRELVRRLLHVKKDQSITVADIPNLGYTPAANANGIGYA